MYVVHRAQVLGSGARVRVRDLAMGTDWRVPYAVGTTSSWEEVGANVMMRKAMLALVRVVVGQHYDERIAGWEV